MKGRQLSRWTSLQLEGKDKGQKINSLLTAVKDPQYGPDIPSPYLVYTPAALNVSKKEAYHTE